MREGMELWELISQVTKLHISIVTREVAKYGITLSQCLVLGEIECGPKTIGEISKALDLSYSTVSGIVDRLERNQLVVRVRDRQDRRIVWVTLAENLEEMKKKYPFLDREYFARIFTSFLHERSTQEVRSIRRSLEEIVRYLQDVCVKDAANEQET
ncbi:hypothetical protein BSNK01_21650 [Bacillaceae bacterium]